MAMPAAWGMWVAMGELPLMTLSFCEPQWLGICRPAEFGMAVVEMEGGQLLLPVVERGQRVPLWSKVLMWWMRPRPAMRRSAMRSAAAAVVVPSAEAVAITALVVSKIRRMAA